MRNTRPLNVTEVADFLGVHTNTVKRIPSSELPYFTIGKRGDRRYNLEDVGEYIKRRLHK